MWIPGFLKRKARNVAADKLEQIGTDLASGKGAAMDPKMKAILEGAIWAAVAGALGALSGALHDGFQPHDLALAGGAAITALAGYVRGLGQTSPFRDQNERASDPPKS